ncbi:troponin I, fast skeletal muscle-like [Aplochiton taeniatus]
MSEKKMSSSRRYHLKSLILQIAASMLEQEAKDAVAEKEAYMAEHVPALELGGSQQELMELCKKLSQNIDQMDEERYDAEAKVLKADKEVKDLRIKVVDLVGKFKKPALKKVRMSADAMLQALLGSKHSVSMDLRANLKQVKKEKKEEEVVDAGDWRKNIEDKADRKKMFETS